MEYNIKVIGGNVYINKKLHTFAAPMDEYNSEDDLNKKILLALANEMGYEPLFLFDEIADRLWKMMDEPEFF